MLNYLDFETSDDGDGTTTFDAMAYATADRWPALLAEVVQVLGWCTNEFGPPGPLDRGHDWDVDLQLQSDAGHVLAVRWDVPAGKLEALDAGHCNAVQLSMTISGCELVSEGFEAQFLVA